MALSLSEVREQLDDAAVTGLVLGSPSWSWEWGQ